MFTINDWVENQPDCANLILATVWSLWVKWRPTCQRGSHTRGARLWKENVLTEGGHGPLTNTCYWKPWQRRFFVSLTVNHYIIFPAGFTGVLLTDPPPLQAQTSTLSQLPLTTSGGLVSTSPSELPIASYSYCNWGVRTMSLSYTKVLALIYNCEINYFIFWHQQTVYI